MQLYGGSNHVPLHQVSGFYGKVTVPFRLLSGSCSHDNIVFLVFVGRSSVYMDLFTCSPIIKMFPETKWHRPTFPFLARSHEKVSEIYRTVQKSWTPVQMI